jgi:Sulfotransferase domain
MKLKVKREMGKLRHLSGPLWSKSATVRRRIAQFVDNPGGRSHAVFLVGCGRSGTNMLCNGLSRSWQVTFFNEDNPAAFDNYRIRDLAEIEGLVASSPARITLFKPILDSHLTGIFLSRFPKSKAIFVFRHYNDVINSSIQLFGSQNWPSRVDAWINDDFSEYASAPPPEQTKNAIRSRWSPSLNPESSIALYWLFHNLLFFDLSLDEDPSTTLLNYESTVLNPRREFGGLCNFLGIKYSNCLIEGVFSSSIRRGPSPNLDAEILKDCVSLWERLCSLLAQRGHQG